MSSAPPLPALAEGCVWREWSPVDNAVVRCSSSTDSSAVRVTLRPCEVLLLRGACRLRVVSSDVGVLLDGVRVSSSSAAARVSVPAAAAGFPASTVCSASPTDAAVVELCPSSSSEDTAAAAAAAAIGGQQQQPLPPLGVPGLRAVAAADGPFHVVPPQWAALLAELSSFAAAASSSSAAVSVAVLGAVGVGKSALVRHLVNSLLSQQQQQQQQRGVALLDVDLGRPELTPPGLVSLSVVREPLYGPAPHTRLHGRAAPELAFYVGAPTHEASITHYVRCAERLAAEYRRISHESPSPLPLVVNTSGWVVGAGYDSLLAVLRAVAPAFVVQIFPQQQQQQQLLSSPVLLRPEDAAVVCPGSAVRSIPSAVAATGNLAAAPARPPSFAREARETALLAYFGDHIQALACAPAYAVPFSEVVVAFVAEDVPPSQALRALNGTIVGLCSAPEGALQQDQAVGESQYPRFLRDAWRPVPCAGLGLIRAIDTARRLFLVVCPFDPRAARVNVIVRGPGLDLPVSLATAAWVPSRGAVVGAPYVASDVFTQPGGTARVRRYIPRHAVHRFPQQT